MLFRTYPDKRLARSRQQPRESLDRSFVEASAHESRFASRCATRIIPPYIRMTCFIYMMCHAGDTSAAAELRVQLRRIINLLWLPNAIHGIHTWRICIHSPSLLILPCDYLRKFVAIDSFDCILLIFLALLPRLSINLLFSGHDRKRNEQQTKTSN
jgi:hypothetical protein